MADEKDISKLKIDGARLSFPDIWEPKSVKNSEPKYSCHFILPKEDPQALLIEKRLKQNAVAHWGAEKAKKIWESKKFEHCLHDGEEKEDMAGYGEDVIYVTCSSPRRPLIIDRDRTPSH